MGQMYLVAASFAGPLGSEIRPEAMYPVRWATPKATITRAPTAHIRAGKRNSLIHQRRASRRSSLRCRAVSTALAVEDSTASSASAETALFSGSLIAVSPVFDFRKAVVTNSNRQDGRASWANNAEKRCAHASSSVSSSPTPMRRQRIAARRCARICPMPKESGQPATEESLPARIGQRDMESCVIESVPEVHFAIYDDLNRCDPSRTNVLSLVRISPLVHRRGRTFAIHGAMTNSCRLRGTACRQCLLDYRTTAATAVDRRATIVHRVAGGLLGHDPDGRHRDDHGD